MQALSTLQVQSLGSAAVIGLDTTHINVLTTTQIQSLTTAQIYNLTTEQVLAINTLDVKAMTTTQFTSMTTANIAALTTGQIRMMTTTTVASLSSSQINALNSTDVASFYTVQIAALNTSAIAGLSTQLLAAMDTSELMALTTSQIVALQSENIKALHAFSTAHAGVFTAQQVAVMTDGQITSYLFSPIVLNLTGSSINTVGANAGVTFDMAATGSQQHTGWIGAGSGFLVRDLNHDGVINNGSELFGTSTLLASGAKAANGFEALAQLDTNHDGILDAKDAAFNELGVWVDSNSDGITQPGEVYSLSSLNITQFNLNAAHTAVNNNGNWILQDSTYVTSDGITHQMADVWFQKGSAVSTPPAGSSLTPDPSQTLATVPVASSIIQPATPLNGVQPDSLTNNGVTPFSTAQATALAPGQMQTLTATDIYTLSPDPLSSLLPANLPAGQVAYGGSLASLNGNLTSQQELPATALLPSQFQGALPQGQLTQNPTALRPFSQIKPELTKR